MERVLRIVDQDGDDFSVVILDVTRADTINDPARAMLAGMSEMPSAAGKKGLLVDPDAAVIRPGHGFDDAVFSTPDEAVDRCAGVVGRRPRCLQTAVPVGLH